MATLSRADISAVLNLVYQDTLADQFRRDVVLANLLKVEPGRNATCTWRAKFDGRTAGGAYAEGADMSDGDYDSHDRVQATLPWAEYRTGAKVSGLAQSVAAASGGTGQGADLIGEELDDAIDELALHIGSDLYGGNPGASPPELAGAALAIDGTAGTFAGIASSSYGDWLASEDTITQAQLSVSNIRTKLFRPVKDAVGMDPEFVTCPGAIIDLLKDLLGEKAPTVQEVRTERGMVNITAATGMKAISVDGVPFIEDRHCTASTFYAWHSRFVKIRHIPAAKSTRDPNRIIAAMKALTGVDVSVSEVEARLRAGGGRLMPTIEAIAQTGDAYKYMVKWYGQMEFRRRNAFSKLVLT